MRAVAVIVEDRGLDRLLAHMGVGMDFPKCGLETIYKQQALPSTL